MKNNLKILSGIILLFAMISFVSAQYDWATYGNLFSNTISNEQSRSAYGNFNGTQPTNITSLNGYSVSNNRKFVPLQPIQADWFGIGYLFSVKNDTIQVQDKNLNLLNSIYAGIIDSQIAVWDFNNDNHLEVAGIFHYNDSISSLRIFTYDEALNSFSEIYQQNFTFFNGSITTGLRSSGSNFIFVNSIYNNATSFNSTFYKINVSQEINVSLGTFNFTFNEPLSYGDFNVDGVKEYMTYSQKQIIIFNETNLINTINSAGYNILSVRMFLDSVTTYYHSCYFGIFFCQDIPVSNITGYRIAYLRGIDTSTLDLFSYYINGTLIWSDTHLMSTGAGGFFSSNLAISNDIDGDGRNDIMVCGGNFVNASVPTMRWDLISVKGSTGVMINGSIPLANIFIRNVTVNYSVSCTIADLNHDGYEDVIASYGSSIFIYNIAKRIQIYNNTNFSVRSCIPSDINFDGYQEVICSGENGTLLLNSNGINNNANILSVTYDPDISIPINTNLYATISATDSEGNSPLYYNVKCSDSVNWSVENTNPIQACYYSDLGNHNNTIGVRDVYHSDYTMFFQNIIVTPNVTICNNNGVCDSGLGETNTNCPNDCPLIPDTQQSTATGGIPIPTKIVDTENINQGLLPEIYFGTLGFLSNTLQPIMILFFVIFTCLIVLAVGFIIKNISHKVGQLTS